MLCSECDFLIKALDRKLLDQVAGRPCKNPCRVAQVFDAEASDVAISFLVKFQDKQI